MKRRRKVKKPQRPVKRCIVCGSPFYTFPSCRCGYGPEHNR